jgi:hypothetical protein
MQQIGAASASSWDMAEAAGLHSQLAGLLAGFLFLSVTLLIGRQQTADATPEADHLTEALYLLSTSFVVLLVASFMFGVVSGYTDASLALSLGSVAAVLLAIGAVASIAGLAWVVNHSHAVTELERHIERLALLVYSIAFAHLSLTASDSVRGYTPAPLHWIYFIGIGLGLLVLTLALSARRYEHVREPMGRWASRMPSPLNRGVSTSCGLMIGATILVVVLYMIMSNSTNRAHWQTLLANLLGLAAFHVSAVGILSSMPRGESLRQDSLRRSGYL